MVYLKTRNKKVMVWYKLHAYVSGQLPWDERRYMQL